MFCLIRHPWGMEQTYISPYLKNQQYPIHVRAHNYTVISAHVKS